MNDFLEDFPGRIHAAEPQVAPRAGRIDHQGVELMTSYEPKS